MFDSLSDRLGGVFDKLRGRGALSEDDVRAAMREVRVALLEADVALPVARDFVDQVTEQAIGQEVIRSVTPGQMVVKIVNDALVEMLGGETCRAQPRRQSAGGDHDGRPAGLGQDDDHRQARQAPDRKRERKKVLMASLDVARPAAQEQLAVLGAPGRGRRRCRSSPASRRSRSPSARSSRRSCRASTSCCSTPPAASTSTTR